MALRVARDVLPRNRVEAPARDEEFRNRLASGWADELREAGGKASEIAQFTGLIPDVKKGDTMSFTWGPGTGIVVALNGKAHGSVPGDEFTRALFTVWFGPKPGDENLKRGMLVR